MQSGPLGSYTYGDSAHLHAVTAIGTNYSATYDAGGAMTCRAPSSSTTCTGTPTGAVLSFDNEGRLAAWQNTPSSPTTTDSFLYDGEGNRVEQQTTTNGSIITSTVYVAGGLEEVTSSGASTTLTKYFGAAGLPTAERVGTNGPLSYLATDGQGTVSETLDGSGNVTSAQLYTPYGSVRYSSGSSPTSLGYTGQRADSATGLDYYNARYYDPAAGQFISADTVDDGLNRYGYVAGNPTTNTDPSGHMLCGYSGSAGCKGHPQRPPKQTTPPPPAGCHATHTCKSPDDGGGSESKGKPAPGCDQKCRIDEAITYANTTYQDFSNKQLVLLVAGFVVAGAGLALNALGIAAEVIPIVGEILTPLFEAIGVELDAIGGLTEGLMGEANWLGNQFSYNMNWPDSQWSHSSLEQFRSEIRPVLDDFSVGYGVMMGTWWNLMDQLGKLKWTYHTLPIGILGALPSQFRNDIDNFINEWIPKLIRVYNSLTAWSMEDLAMSTIDKEEAAIG